ncbi:sigma-70 family RNA polymerase sigma factor [Catenulispora sp. NF23]|uniref:Sigma-70 family RNA polymerase sigma factor n=1 Tax=Catenulispora pinistramenti TaxID=2705254 RepID=A0ABS5KWV5_9ACTN|nr:sigma-70 family RNA polymerase sigma factor [Catenulispora pinistramenti]MBS2536284.1 sigma-70 family RNA polymerase sigma factor [Catenulispora pinistramenti]MBS2550551.1 sigma-70 family RNA polymerase sigma factor [Catenulispora pinistramenti]
MTDREMVTALRAGDQLAIGQIYDTYGARLYAYCYDLLADHELAADALRDAFIVANNRIRELGNPDELGAWLYALSRAEALRLGVSDDIPADAAQGTRNDRFARAALDVYAMLPPETREILDLAFRHRMVDGDLSLVMDMTEEQIGQVVQDAQEDLENGLTAVLANRVGDPRCAEIAELGKRFDRLDGKAVDPWLDSVSRHVKADQACADHIENRRPLRLFEELPHAFVPPGVRARVLDTLRDPAGAAFCQRIASRAGDFDESGFPTGGGKSKAGGARKLLPIFGIVAVVAVVGGVAYAVVGGGGGSGGSAGNGTTSSVSSTTSDTSSAAASTTAGASATPSTQQATDSATGSSANGGVPTGGSGSDTGSTHHTSSSYRHTTSSSSEHSSTPSKKPSTSSASSTPSESVPTGPGLPSNTDTTPSTTSSS